jgi:hypothetical protein
MEIFFRETTGNPLFISKYTPYANDEKKADCSAAFHPGRRIVIFISSVHAGEETAPAGK